MLLIGTKIVTLSDLEQLGNLHYALYHTIRQLSEPSASNSPVLCLRESSFCLLYTSDAADE